MSKRILTACTFLFLGLAAAPQTHAQDDPFEAIVANPDGANVRLDDVAIPIAQPTNEGIQDYLRSFENIDMRATFTADDGKRGKDRRTNVAIPIGNAQIGPFTVPNGTKFDMRGTFEKRPGEKEGVLRRLEMIPSSPMALGPLRIKKMVMDKNGVIRCKLNLKMMGISFWPQEMTIEKIYTDAQGNMVIKTGGTGLAGKFVPDMRITPDGRVQRYSRGIWLFGRPFAKWKDVKVDGEVVKLDSPLPIKNWPMKATNILDWLPPSTDEPDPGLAAFNPLLDAVPVKDLSLSFSARGGKSDPIRLQDGSVINLSNHTMRFDANGSFEGRTFKTDPTKPNGYKATATLTGDINNPKLGKVKIDRVDVNLEGKTSAEIPFNDPSKTKLEATFKARASGKLTGIDAGMPGKPRLKTGEATASFDGDGKVVLRPYKEGDEDAKREITISRDSNYKLKVKGPIELSNLNSAAPEGTKLPDTLKLVPADDPQTPDVDESKGPVLLVNGKLGTKMGFIFAKTDIDLHGKTAHGGAISALNGTGANKTEITTTLKPGARIHFKGYAFAGIKEKTLEGGGVRLTADARISGTGENTTVKGNGLEAKLPGDTKVDVRVATNVRHGTKNGAETVVRGLAAKATVELEKGEGTIKSGLPGGPTLKATLAPGTKFTAETGHLRRTDPRGNTALETDGYKRGEKTARLSAHLVLTAGSMAHKDLAVAFNGKTTVDLSLAMGFQFDPRSLTGAAPANTPTVSKPIPMDLDMSINFTQGSTLSVKQPNSLDGKLTLGGATSFKLHASVTVDPKTGKPTLQALDGIDVTIEAEAIDLKKLMTPLGKNLSISSRSSVRIKNARVEFKQKGLRIHHKGIVLELEPGTIDIGG